MIPNEVAKSLAITVYNFVSVLSSKTSKDFLINTVIPLASIE